MSDDMTGLEQSEGKIIVDARGTVRRVSPLEPEAEEKKPEAKGVVRDLAAKAATAVAGGLVAEAFDAIQDAAERARVSGEVHKRDKEYENDLFGTLTYGELRVVLATGRHGGKKLAPEEAEAARNSRQTRYREAASYGVMTGVGGLLRSKLVEADWTDYPTRIAEVAKSAEDEAMGKYEYRYNPRIQGAVSDAVSRTELLVRLDGYKGLTDLNNPKNVEKLRQLKIADINKEMEALEARIANEVLWDPEGGKYAGLVNQETPRQKEERLEKEKITSQQQHELDLVRAKAAAETAAQAQVPPPGGLEGMFAPVDVKEKPGEIPLFREDGYFVAKYNIPKIITYFEGFQKIKRRAVHGLTDALINGVMEALGSIDIRNSAGEEFGWAFKALFASRDKTKSGSWKELTGSADDGIPSALEGFNFKFSSIYLSKDLQFTRAVDILMAADGSLGDSFVGEKDKAVVDKLVQKGYRDWLKSPGSVWVAKPAHSQAELRKEMDNFSEEIARHLQSEEIARHLQIDVGLVYLARQMVAFMGYGVEMEAMRTLRAKAAKEGSVYALVAKEMVKEGEGPKESSLKTFLEKASIKGEQGKLAAAYKEGGFLRMAEVAAELKAGNEVFLWARGMRTITDNLDDIDNMLRGEGAALFVKDKEGYLAKINEFLSKMTLADPPLLRKETGVVIIAEAQKEWDKLNASDRKAVSELSRAADILPDRFREARELDQAIKKKGEFPFLDLLGFGSYIRAFGHIVSSFKR